MKDARYFGISLLVMLLQVLVRAEFNLSPYLVLALLPTVVLCLPTRIPDIGALLLTFCMAFVTDFLSDGAIGLCIAALLPVCFLKNATIRLLFGSEIFSRKDNLSLNRTGVLKFTLALLIVNSIFLAVYIWADAAGTRSWNFLAERFLISLSASTLCGLLIAKLLEPDRKKWN